MVFINIFRRDVHFVQIRSKRFYLHGIPICFFLNRQFRAFDRFIMNGRLDISLSKA